MTCTYVPILNALPAEFHAFVRMKSEASSVIPLFNLPERGKCKYLLGKVNRALKNVAAVCEGREAIIDGFHWQAHDSILENDEHFIYHAAKKLISSNVNVIPVIGCDRWHSEDGELYREALTQVVQLGISRFCLRIDKESLEYVYDHTAEDFAAKQIDEILTQLEIEPSNVMVLLDFGRVNSTDKNYFYETVSEVIYALSNRNFRSIIIAAGSMPVFINEAVTQEDSTDYLERIEMLVWKKLKKEFYAKKLIYSDYGVRSPAPSESNGGNKNNHNGRIRHTINDKFFIVRGHRWGKERNWSQMPVLAKKTVESEYYLQPEFSWGDRQTYDCSIGMLKWGELGDWIAIDTSHHLAFVVNEVLSYEKELAAAFEKRAVEGVE